MAETATTPRNFTINFGPQLAPELFDCCQDAKLVVDKNVTLGWVTPLDIIEGFFLMNINQHTSIHRSSES